ncbi:hypothetical protein OH77DRAFT_338700 [Trametes cingulata]|nr:hypothetical protein OH77DRAFT_338700 [Trametes cingulata]
MAGGPSSGAPNCAGRRQSRDDILALGVAGVGPYRARLLGSRPVAVGAIAKRHVAAGGRLYAPQHIINHLGLSLYALFLWVLVLSIAVKYRSSAPRYFSIHPPDTPHPRSRLYQPPLSHPLYRRWTRAPRPIPRPRLSTRLPRSYRPRAVDPAIPVQLRVILVYSLCIFAPCSISSPLDYAPLAICLSHASTHAVMDPRVLSVSPRLLQKRTRIAAAAYRALFRLRLFHLSASPPHAAVNARNHIVPHLLIVPYGGLPGSSHRAHAASIARTSIMPCIPFNHPSIHSPSISIRKHSHWHPPPSEHLAAAYLFLSLWSCVVSCFFPVPVVYRTGSRLVLFVQYSLLPRLVVVALLLCGYWIPDSFLFSSRASIRVTPRSHLHAPISHSCIHNNIDICIRTTAVPARVQLQSVPLFCYTVSILLRSRLLPLRPCLAVIVDTRPAPRCTRGRSYFPQGSRLHAECTSRPSLTMRTIHSARHTLVGLLYFFACIRQHQDVSHSYSDTASAYLIS